MENEENNKNSSEEIVSKQVVDSENIDFNSEVEKTIESISNLNIGNDADLKEISEEKTIETEACNFEKNVNLEEKQREEETKEDDSKNKTKEKKKRDVDPASIPRKGYFFEHDNREHENDEKTASASNEKNENSNKASKRITSGENTSANNRNRNNRKNRKPRYNSENNIDRWQHDKFDLLEQKPKSKQEIVRRYGYDIREQNDNRKKSLENQRVNNNNRSLNNQSPRKNEKISQRRHSDNFDNEDEDDDLFQRHILINNNDDDDKINLAQLRRRRPNDINNNNNNKNNNNFKNRFSLNADIDQQPKPARVFDNSKSKLKNLQMNSFKNQNNSNNNNNNQRQQQRQNQIFSKFQSDSNAQNLMPINNKQDLKSIEQEMPKRYSSIRNNQQPLSGQLLQNKLFTINNQQLSGINLDQNSFQNQFMFNNNSHSPVQQQQPIWPNQPRPLTHHIQQNTIQQHMNMQPPPGLSLNTQSTSSSSTVTQQQMAALINNQLYYMQPNDYMTQLSAAQEYAATMAVLQANPMYFTNQSLPQHQQQSSSNPMSPMSQLGLQRQSKAIPIVNPHQLNQRNF